MSYTTLQSPKSALSLLRANFPRLACPPPVENDVVLTVTAPAASGQVAGIPEYQVSESSLISTHLKPAGASGAADRFQSCVAGSPGVLGPSTSIAARISPIAATTQIPQNVIALTDITAPPVVVPPIIRTQSTPKKSNLDLTGMRLVKKGVMVSWHGYRFHVSKVRMGTWYPVFSPCETRRFFDCSSVQVVS